MNDPLDYCPERWPMPLAVAEWLTDDEKYHWCGCGSGSCQASMNLLVSLAEARRALYRSRGILIDEYLFENPHMRFARPWEG